VPGLLYLGDWAHAEDHGVLRDLGIRRLLTIHNMPETLKAPPPGVAHLRQPLADVESEDVSAHFDAALAFIDAAAKARTRVLVHCGAGVSRSASLVIAYLIRANGWSAERALAHAQRCRSVVAPNEGFLRQLRAFAAACGNAGQGADGKAQAAPRRVVEEEDAGALRALLATYGDGGDAGGAAIAGWDSDEDAAAPPDVKKAASAAAVASAAASAAAAAATAAPTSAPPAAAPPSAGGGALLDVLKDGVLLSRLPLPASGSLTFGRLPECGVVLEHASISRAHARLVRLPGGDAWGVVDEGSAHGTFCNEQRVPPRAPPARLPDGATLRFGGSTRRYVFRAAPPPSAPPAAEADAGGRREERRHRSRKRSRSRERSRREEDSRSPRRRRR
jgi:dual specificity MAP kinase phosphatase